MTSDQNTPKEYEPSAFLNIPVKSSDADTIADTIKDNAGEYQPSAFLKNPADLYLDRKEATHGLGDTISLIIRRQAAALIPHNGFNDYTPPEILDRAVQIRGVRIKDGIEPGNYPTRPRITGEGLGRSAISHQVRARLKKSGIRLFKPTTNLSDAARKLVLSDVLKKFGNSENPTEILARLEKMGLVIDEELITTVTRTYNDKISANTPPTPDEIDPVDEVAAWFSQKAEKLHDYALGINQPVKDTTPKITIKQRLGEMTKEASGKVGKILSTVRENVGSVLEKYSNRDEKHSGLRTRLAQLLTGKESITRPTFMSNHQTEEQDWAEKFLEKVESVIELLRNRMPQLRPAQLRILLGFVAFTNRPDENDVALEQINTPIAREIGHFQEKESADKPMSEDSPDLERWFIEHTLPIVTDSPIREMSKREQAVNAISMAERKKERFKNAGVTIEDVRRKERERLVRIEERKRLEKLQEPQRLAEIEEKRKLEMLAEQQRLGRIETERRQKIQNAGGIDPNRGGANMLRAFENLPVNGNPADIRQAMNEEGLFA